LPLSKYGLKTSLGYLLGDHKSAATIMMRTDKKVYLDFEAVNTKTRKKVAGKALILDRVQDKYFIIVFDNKVYTIGDYGDVDLLSSKERIAYTAEPETRYEDTIKTSNYQELLQKIPATGYVKGTIEYPDNYSISARSNVTESFRESSGKLTFDFISAEDLKHLTWQRQPTAEEKTYQREIERQRIKMAAVLTSLQENDGLTDLSRKKLGVDHTKDEKYISARALYLEALQSYNNLVRENKQNETWSGKLVIVAI
jgi:hypothetical protein